MSKQTAAARRNTPNPFGTAGFEAFANPFAFNPFAATFGAKPGPFGSETFANGPDHALRAWIELNRAVLEGVGKLQQETSRFVIRRLEGDLDRQREILQSRSPEDALQKCADFARQTVQDYADEAGRLSEIAAEMQYACAGFGEMLASAAVESATDAKKAA